MLVDRAKLCRRIFVRLSQNNGAPSVSNFGQAAMKNPNWLRKYNLRPPSAYCAKRLLGLQNLMRLCSNKSQERRSGCNARRATYPPL